jgi:hypothetical protein
MTDSGIQSSAGIGIANPLPKSWLGKSTAPPLPPNWANIGALTNVELRALLAQIGYDHSGWNYSLIGTNNQLGRYQISSAILEAYGLLIAGSNENYGSACVNYNFCWNPIYINNGINAYQNYFYNTTNLSSFLTTTIAQEHLAYQRLVDIYLTSKNIGAILTTDAPDVVAGMIYVAWTLGVGTPAAVNQSSGTGAWAWRYYNIGAGANSYNSGRYAITVLST